MARMDDVVPLHLRPNNWHELLGDLLEQGWGFWPVYNRLKAASARAKSAEYIAITLLNMAKEPVVPPGPPGNETRSGDRPGQGARGTRSLPAVIHTTDLHTRSRGLGRTIETHPYEPDIFTSQYCEHCQLPQTNRIHRSMES